MVANGGNYSIAVENGTRLSIVAAQVEYCEWGMCERHSMDKYWSEDIHTVQHDERAA